MSILTLIGLLVALVVGLAVSVALAYVPMRLLLERMARNITSFMQRQKERRRVERGTPDRRHT